jgi:hypothetical protein
LCAALLLLFVGRPIGIGVAALAAPALKSSSPEVAGASQSPTLSNCAQSQRQARGF